MTVKITMTTTMPTPRALKGRIDGAARQVLLGWGRSITRTFQDAWVGWQYKGRPATAPRLVSHDAWTFTVDTTGGGRDARGRFKPNSPCVIVRNEARDWRRNTPYVVAVHRAGSRRPEWLVVAERDVAPLLPAFAAELTAAFAQEVRARVPRRKVGTAGGSATQTAGMVL